MVAIMPCLIHIILIHVSQLLADMILIRYLDIHFLNFHNVTGAIDWTEEVYPIKTSNLTSGFLWCPSSFVDCFCFTIMLEYVLLLFCIQIVLLDMSTLISSYLVKLCILPNYIFVDIVTSHHEEVRTSNQRKLYILVLVFCVVYHMVCFSLFCVMCPKLPVFLDSPLLIIPSVFGFSLTFMIKILIL